MPFDPTTPRSRDEVLLQAIVSGDSSAMGDPRDREEEFVKAIADKETLPDYSEASEGDVLQIGTDGPEWAAPSGGELYEHNIYIGYSSGSFKYNTVVTIYNGSSTSMAVSDVAKWLYDTGHTTSDKIFSASYNYVISGYSDSEGPGFVFQNGMYSSNGTTITVPYTILTSPANAPLTIHSGYTITLSIGGVDVVKKII